MERKRLKVELIYIFLTVKDFEHFPHTFCSYF